MLGQRGEDAGGHGAAIGPALDGEALPSVGISGPRGARKIRRIHEDPVEATEPSSEVRPDRRNGEPFRAGPGEKVAEGRWVEVGGDDPRPAPRRREGGRAPPAAHLEDSVRDRGPGEPGEQPRVLPNGIDGSGAGVPDARTMPVPRGTGGRPRFLLIESRHFGAYQFGE
jgi:hypothetical protein